MNYLAMISISLWSFSIGLYIGLYHRKKLNGTGEKIVKNEKDDKEEITKEEVEALASLINLLNYDGTPQKRENADEN